MTDDSVYDLAAGKSADKKGRSDDKNPNQPTIIIQNNPAKGGWWSRILMFILSFSIMLNIVLMASVGNQFVDPTAPQETYVKGDSSATDKLAIIEISGTIMPPLTERVLKAIEQTSKDKLVKGVMLVVDSPGGLVTDSHQIYHRLKKLSDKLPVYVSMKRLAASGGYYVSMGAGPKGKIFAEPTTWTGSIGVIMPRYDLSELALKFGVKSDPLTTGEFKNTLDPLKPLNDEERKLWANILNQSYESFVNLIDENREKLDKEAVKKLATGQIYTADDAIKNGLVDEIAFEDEILDKLKSDLKLTSVKVIKYKHTPTITDFLAGNAQAKEQGIIEQLLESSVPRAMYYFAWNGAIKNDM